VDRGVTAPALICVVPNPSIDRTAEVDRVVPGRIHRPDDVLAVPGGKGLNVARPAWSLGLPVEAILLLAGHAGRWIVEQLDAIGLPHREAWADGETRSCLSILDRSTGELTEIYEPGPIVRPADWAAFVDLTLAAIADAAPGAIVALSGSLPGGTPDDAAATIVAAVAEGGRKALVDTSGPPLGAALAARPFLVKVNATEAGALLGRSADTEADALETARELVARGAQRAILTRGGDGAVGWDGKAGWTVRAPDGGGRWTVGSGDAFLAGLAMGLAADDAFETCLVRAVGTATASTRVRGPGLVDAADVAQAVRRTTVRRIA